MQIREVGPDDVDHLCSPGGISEKRTLLTPPGTPAWVGSHPKYCTSRNAILNGSTTESERATAKVMYLSVENMHQGHTIFHSVE